MKKKQNNSARASALQIALVVALISASAVLLAESFTPQFSQRATASAARTAPVMSPIEKPAAIFTVTNTNDSGPGSLRQAITDADNMPDLDTIEFNIPSNDPGCNPTTQVCTITLGSALPFLQTPMIIDGYTQPGAQPNTNETGGLNTVLKIELSGGASSKGFVIIFTSDVTVRGLVINHCSATAIECDTNFPNIHIEGNFIGTDASGTQAESTGGGITIQTAGAAQVFIGGPNAFLSFPKEKLCIDPLRTIERT